MKYGLAIFFGTRLLNLKESQHVVIEFGSEAEANAFAVRMIRADPSEFCVDIEDLAMNSDAELLELVQDGVGITEYFHVFPIVSPDFIQFPTPTPTPVTDEMQQLADASKGG